MYVITSMAPSCCNGVHKVTARSLKGTSADAGKYVKELHRCCDAIARYMLPPEVAEKLAAIKKLAGEIEYAIRETQLETSTSPFPTPGVEEQADWSKICPTGAALLHTGACVCMEETSRPNAYKFCTITDMLEAPFNSVVFEQEWFVGQFYFNKDGLMFHGDHGFQSPVFCTGLLLWSGITEIREDSSLGPRSLYIQFDPSITVPFSALKLEFSNRRDGSWIEEAWKMYKGVKDPDADVADCFALPPAKSPETDEPIYSEVLDHVDFPTLLRTMCGAHWIFEKQYQEDLGAFDIKATKWTQGKRLPTTKVRKVTFQMPLKDIPAAAAALVSIPENTHVTVICRAESSEDSLTLIMHTCTHDVMFGENFRVQDVFSFKSVDDGLEFKKWTSVIWIKPLSFVYSAITVAVESQTKTKSQEAGAYLAKLLRQTVGDIHHEEEKSGRKMTAVTSLS